MKKWTTILVLLVCCFGIYFVSQDCSREHSFFKIAEQEGLNENISVNNSINPEDLPKYEKGVGLSIPAISHHIWLTSLESPKNINSIDLKHILNTILVLDSGHLKWQHILWINDACVNLSSIKALEQAGMTIRNVKELQNPLLQGDIERMLKISSFSEASDLIRYLALQKYGGLYLDTDYELFFPIDNLMQLYDFIAAEHLYYYHSPEDKSFESLGSAFIAAKKFHPIINQTLAIITRNLHEKKLPNYIKDTCYINDRIWVETGPMTVTVAYFQKRTDKDIVFQFKYFYNRCHQKRESMAIGCHDFNGDWFGGKEKKTLQKLSSLSGKKEFF